MGENIIMKYIYIYFLKYTDTIIDSPRNSYE